MTDVQLTSTNYDKTVPQYQVYGTKIYFVWQETDNTNTQIWTAVSNLDGSSFTATKQTTSAYNKRNPQLQVFSNKIYYVYEGMSGTTYQIWVARADLDGGNWSTTQLTVTAGHHCYLPQLQVVGDKIYYVYIRWEQDYVYGLWTGYSDLDGANFNYFLKDDASTWGIFLPQLQVVGDKIYYVYTIYQEDIDPYRQIMVATSNLDSTDWSTTKKTSSSYNKITPQFQVVNSKIYYVWEEIDDTPKSQIWTASMNIDGSGWSATKRTIDSNQDIYPQLQVTGKLYYIFDNSDQIAFGSMKINQTDWAYENQTTGIYYKNNPQLQVVDNKVYFVWSGIIGSYFQLWLGGITLETGGVTVTTKDASCKDRQSTTLTAIGIITDVEGEYTYRGFEFYEVGTEYLDSMYAVREIGEFYSTGEFEMTLSGLKPLTCYYIRAFAGSVIGGIFYGGWVICCTTEVPSYDIYTEENNARYRLYVSDDEAIAWRGYKGPYSGKQTLINISDITNKTKGVKVLKVDLPDVNTKGNFHVCITVKQTLKG